MRSIATLVLIALIATLTGCVVPVESSPDTETASVEPQSGGSGCAANQTVCYVWSGLTQVYGTCTAAHSCCTGCIDARGACQTGGQQTTCGAHGASCNDCTASGTMCFGDASIGFACVASCNSFASCNERCAGEADGTVCNYCGMTGACFSGACKQVQSGPTSCG